MRWCKSFGEIKLDKAAHQPIYPQALRDRLRRTKDGGKPMTWSEIMDIELTKANGYYPDLNKEKHPEFYYTAE